MIEYCIVRDESGHRYVIPLDKRDDWYRWCELDQDTEPAWNVPAYAVEVDGGQVVFPSWRIA